MESEQPRSNNHCFNTLSQEETIMTDTSLLDDPIIIESIHKASDKLLRRSQNKENQHKEKSMSITNIKETLLREVSELSPIYCPKVLDFIESLKTKRQPVIPEIMLLSEAALSKDWNTAEEDNAWASL
jgi:hypothetical protein